METTDSVDGPPGGVVDLITQVLHQNQLSGRAAADLALARRIHYNASKAQDVLLTQVGALRDELERARDELESIDELVGPVYEFANGERIEVDMPLVDRVRWLKQAAGAEGDETSRVRGQLLRCQAALKDALETIINQSKGA
jgi:hypothetical protein